MSVRFDMVGIFVSDLERMVRFYQKVIGLPVEMYEGGPYAEFQHEGVRFSMYERRLLPELLGTTPGYPDGLNGTFELAINVGERLNVDQTYDRLTESGAQPVYAPRDEPWKMRSAMVADPEGDLIEIASDFWE
jgi:catechol 2,3-dioxygenase-like lactoylglutathione lyase family enzyme